jgi:hypothetical protein
MNKFIIFGVAAVFVPRLIFNIIYISSCIHIEFGHHETPYNNAKFVAQLSKIKAPTLHCYDQVDYATQASAQIIFDIGYGGNFKSVYTTFRAYQLLYSQISTAELCSDLMKMDNVRVGFENTSWFLYLALYDLFGNCFFVVFFQQ